MLKLTSAQRVSFMARSLKSGGSRKEVHLQRARWARSMLNTRGTEHGKEGQLQQFRDLMNEKVWADRFPSGSIIKHEVFGMSG